MAQHPIIRKCDWLNVGSVRCVAMQLYPDNSIGSVRIVVCNKNNPTTRDVDWNGQEWIFPDRPDFGGYPHQSNQYVQQLLGKR